MSADDPEWTFFSHYALVLICLAENPMIRLREVAERVGVTERTAMRLIDRLDRLGVVRRTRRGRRNFYEIDTRAVPPHPIEASYSIDRLLRIVLRAESGRVAGSDGSPEGGVPPKPIGGSSPASALRQVW